jgi:hypothetical protein
VQENSGVAVGVKDRLISVGGTSATIAVGVAVGLSRMKFQIDSAFKKATMMDAIQLKTATKIGTTTGRRLQNGSFSLYSSSSLFFGVSVDFTSGLTLASQIQIYTNNQYNEKLQLWKYPFVI